MPVQVAAVIKGIQIAGQVKQAADTVNTVSQKLNINQDSIFAKNEKEGKGGAINGVLQAADTVTGGVVSKAHSLVDKTTGGMTSKVTQAADKIATPVLNVVAGSSSEGGTLDKLTKMKPTQA